jgi:HAD superfamily hydrolase (TIGR01484 family)
MPKKLIAFDLDDTLAISKAPISDRMAYLMAQLLEKFEVCIISGGKFDQFKLQVTERLEITPELMRKFHMMPTCGTRYYRYDEVKDEWVIQYAEDLTEAQRKKIITVLEEEAAKLDLKNPKTWGPIIEDRQSQIAYSILGQQAPPEEKYKWVESHLAIKQEFHRLVSERLPDLEVRMGGSTTLDITKLGIDKAYGMTKLMEKLQLGKSDILFAGDKLQEGGNDYPVKAMGIDCIAVEGWEDTALVIETILKVS